MRAHVTKQQNDIWNEWLAMDSDRTLFRVEFVVVLLFLVVCDGPQWRTTHSLEATQVGYMYCNEKKKKKKMKNPYTPRRTILCLFIFDVNGAHGDGM